MLAAMGLGVLACAALALVPAVTAPALGRTVTGLVGGTDPMNSDLLVLRLSGITAEIGSMAVTEQVDAIRALGASPVKKLVVPKVLATLIMLPVLTILADFIGIFGGLIISVKELNQTSNYYIQHVITALTFDDIFSGVGKTFFFASNRSEAHTESAASLQGRDGYTRLLDRLRAPGNGLFDIYRIDASALGLASPCPKGS